MFNDPSGMEGEKWGEEGRTYNGKPVRYGNLDTDRGVMNFTEGYNPDTGNFDIIAAEFAPDNVVQGEARDKGWFSLSANLQGGRWLDIRGISAEKYEYTDDGFSDPYNYGAAINNTLGAIWNGVVGVGDAVINNVGLVDDAYRSISEGISNQIDYYSNTSAEQQWSDVKSTLKNPDLYTNLVAFGLTMKATAPTPKAPVYEFPNVTTASAGPTGVHYSVAYEMNLSANSYPGVTRYMHFKEANIALDVEMKVNPALSELGISVPRSSSGSIIGKSPSGWVWHHSTESGLMQLVPKVQHPNIPGGIFWETMHPGGVGGYSIWGK